MLVRLWMERLGSQFWIVPAFIATLIVATLPLLTSVRLAADWPVLEFILRDLSASGARSILTAIATAVMTVVGVLFSVTVVVLQQVSTQFSPRVIENFIRSRTSRIVFGVYIGTVVFCLLLVRQIPETVVDAKAQLPQLATATAIFLTIISFGLLIHYIHHIVQAIKSTTIIETIVDATLVALRKWEQLLSRVCSAEGAPEDTVARDARDTVVSAVKRGYIQGFNWTEIAKCLQGHPWRIEVLMRPGDYVQKGTPLLRIQTRHVGDGEIRDILSEVAVGKERTYAQDVRYGVRQLVDIALKALSPSVNDPTTAEEALSGIESILLVWSERNQMRDRMRFDEGIVLRADVDDEEMAHLALAEIVQAARELPRIHRRLLLIHERLRTAKGRPNLQAAIRTEIPGTSPA
jgi:uncharacterized membrane protein